jgi:hypothetical protein
LSIKLLHSLAQRLSLLLTDRKFPCLIGKICLEAGNSLVLFNELTLLGDISLTAPQQRQNQTADSDCSASRQAHLGILLVVGPVKAAALFRSEDHFSNIRANLIISINAFNVTFYQKERAFVNKNQINKAVEFRRLFLFCDIPLTLKLNGCH